MTEQPAAMPGECSFESSTPLALLTQLWGSPARIDEPPRAMIVVAHPDDEVISLGASLCALPGATIVHVTDGAPRDGKDAAAAGFNDVRAYAAARREELYQALALAGILPEQTTVFEFPDQQAALHLVEIAQRLSSLILLLRPDLIVTHPYEGGHPDHDAAAFAVRSAARLVARRKYHPVLIEATSYHHGPAGIETDCFLPGNVDGERGDVFTRRLLPAECELKRRMVECFPSQRQTLSYFPIAEEHFRLAPEYDFTRPPHPGTLFYENFRWGITGERFRTLARAGLRELEAEDA